MSQRRLQALGLEVTTDGDVDTASWANATSATVRGNTVLVGSAVEGVRQIRYLWADNACLGWNSSSATRSTDPSLRCPLYTAAGLPVLPFVLSLTGHQRPRSPSSEPMELTHTQKHPRE